MAAYWPHAETDVNSSEINKRMARKMNSYKKYIYLYNIFRAGPE